MIMVHNSEPPSEHRCIKICSVVPTQQFDTCSRSIETNTCQGRLVHKFCIRIRHRKPNPLFQTIFQWTVRGTL